MPVALQGSGERVLPYPVVPAVIGGQSGGPGDGRPAGSIVPVIIAGVGLAAPVGVEVQVRRQLVAHAPTGYGAAHPIDLVRERPGICIRAVCRGYPVAVEVVPYGIELRQGCYLDQPVIVGVVVH